MSEPRRPDVEDFAAMMGLTLAPWHRALLALIDAKGPPPPIPEATRGDQWRALKARFAEGGYVKFHTPIEGIPALLSPPRVMGCDIAAGPDQCVELTVAKNAAGQIKVVGRKWWLPFEQRWVTDAEMVLPDEPASEEPRP